jgi:hypothetical protein
MEQELILVQYNDMYGNGTDRSNEVLVKTKEDFDIWLEQYNENRVEQGESECDEEEFDLFRITLFTPEK